MKKTSKSALNVQFDLRAAKQVERRMIVDTLQRLAQAQFPIRDYKYTGMGSIHFVDFVIFHRLLGIDDMLSVEHDSTLEDRVKFNRPFKCIKTKMCSATDVIPTLSQDEKHLLWLDYDEPVTSEILNDVFLAGSQLSTGSILVVTVDVEPPDKVSDNLYASKAYFEREARKYLSSIDDKDFAEGNLHKTSKRVIINALKEGMAGRTGINYYPLFFFVYADGHRMMTVGGIIGSKVEKRKINSMDIEGATYLRMNIDSAAYEIKIPVLTRKERQLLDSAMPCDAGWQPKEFAVPANDIEAYREIYRFFPAYAELLL